MTFEFANPAAFALLAFIPGLVFLGWVLVARGRAANSASSSIFDGLPKSWKQRLRWILIAVRCVAVVCFATALARPELQAILDPDPVDAVDVMVVLDTSSSMASQDFSPDNRLEVAKRIIGEFIQRRPGDRLGLVSFARFSALRCPLTTDHEILVEQLNRTGMSAGDDDGTAIGMALASAVNHLRRSPAASRIAVLLTDGDNNRSTIDPATGIELARSFGVKIYTVGVGRSPIGSEDDGADASKDLAPQKGTFNERGLHDIAEATGGRYNRAEDTAGFEAIFSEIDALERSPVVEAKKLIVAQYFWAPAMFALALMVGELVLRHGLFRKIP